MHPFKLNFLDHVAIRVKDMERSITWYEKTLGLKKYQLEKWGDWPIFMLSGKAGIAIFPANTSDPKIPRSGNVKIDHFAFNVSNESFAKAQEHFQSIGEKFEFQDHDYFHSVYLTDPDGHIVELTTIMVDEQGFYK